MEQRPFSDPREAQKFVQETDTAKELLQKELDVNRVEQNLLKKRVLMMQEWLNDLPSSDPQYSTLALQIQMDQIEIDELKIRQSMITEKLTEIKKIL